MPLISENYNPIRMKNAAREFLGPRFLRARTLLVRLQENVKRQLIPMLSVALLTVLSTMAAPTLAQAPARPPSPNGRLQPWPTT